MNDRIEDLSKRLMRLEAHNRRFRWLAGGLVAVLTAGALMGQTNPDAGGKPQRVIEAEKFVLRDKHGKERGIWEVEDRAEAVLLTLFSPDRSSYAVLRTQVHESGVVVCANGNMVMLEASASHARTWLTSTRDDQQVLVGDWLLEGDTSGYLRPFQNPNQGRHTQWASTPDGTQSFSLVDKQGKVVLELP